MEKVNYIGYYRDLNGLTKADLSRISGVDRSTITRLEKRGGGNIGTLRSIAESLHITTDLLQNGPAKDLTEYADGESVPGMGTIRRYDPTDVIPVLGKIPAGPWSSWV